MSIDLVKFSVGAVVDRGIKINSISTSKQSISIILDKRGIEPSISTSKQSISMVLIPKKGRRTVISTMRHQKG